MDLTSVGFVTNCVKLFGFDWMICGNSLPASFRSDCVLKYELSKLAFSLSSVYIISFSIGVGLLPLFLGGSVSVPGFVIQYLVSFLVLQPSHLRRF